MQTYWVWLVIGEVVFTVELVIATLGAVFSSWWSTCLAHGITWFTDTFTRHKIIALWAPVNTFVKPVDVVLCKTGTCHAIFQPWTVTSTARTVTSFTLLKHRNRSNTCMHCRSQGTIPHRMPRPPAAKHNALLFCFYTRNFLVHTTTEFKWQNTALNNVQLHAWFFYPMEFDFL